MPGVTALAEFRPCFGQLQRKATGHGYFRLIAELPAFKGVLDQLEAAVLPAVLGQVLGNGGRGGLSAIVAKLEQAGFGEQVRSWLGNGQNLPITAEQLQSGAG